MPGFAAQPMCLVEVAAFVRKDQGEFLSEAERNEFRDRRGYTDSPVARPRYAFLMHSIHDSLLTGYSVDGTNRMIRLHTEPHQGGGSAVIDVIFKGVAAYHFEADCLGNIVFGIEEVPAASIIDTTFVERAKHFGWPRGWNSNNESPEEFFSRVGCRIYEIHCSYGMYGWVAAEEMEQVIC